MKIQSKIILAHGKLITSSMFDFLFQGLLKTNCERKNFFSLIKREKYQFVTLCGFMPTLETFDSF